MDDPTLSSNPNSVQTLSDPVDRVGSQTDAPNDPETPDSVHSVRDSIEDDFWAAVPASRLTIVRLYLRSQKEKDQLRAQDLCEEYGLEYETAKQKASAL